MPNNQPSTGRMVGIFVSGVVVGGLLIWGWSSVTPSTNNNSAGVANSNTPTGSDTGAVDTTGSVTGTTAPTPTDTTTSANTGLNLAVASTQPAGSQVAVTSATVSQPTWIIVYDNVNGKPGKALGAHLATPAENGKASVVHLMRATVAGQTYLVGERVDNGDKNYSTALDKEVLGTDGKPAYITLHVQ